jgi:hypothetical protein
MSFDVLYSSEHTDVLITHGHCDYEYPDVVMFWPSTLVSICTNVLYLYRAFNQGKNVGLVKNLPRMLQHVLLVLENCVPYFYYLVQQLASGGGLCKM